MEVYMKKLFSGPPLTRNRKQLDISRSPKLESVHVQDYEKDADRISFTDY
jgi:hypothetical protein